MTGRYYNHCTHTHTHTHTYTHVHTRTHTHTHTHVHTHARTHTHVHTHTHAHTRTHTHAHTQTLLQPISSPYQKLAAECVKHGVAVELFLLPTGYSDVATLGQFVATTGGELHLFEGYQVG